MAKREKIGRVIAGKDKQGNDRFSIGLGYQPKVITEKNKPYVRTVEIIVKDHENKVVAHQLNGFINLQNPRKVDDELLANGVISEEEYNKRKQKPITVPENIKYDLILG